MERIMKQASRTLIGVVSFLLIAFTASIMSGCGGSSSTTSTTSSFAGTQARGFLVMDNRQQRRNFTATNNTKSVNYAGSVTALAGTQRHIETVRYKHNRSRLNYSSSDAYAYSSQYRAAGGTRAILCVRVCSGIQESIRPPVFATAQGSCPQQGQYQWITMPPATWCSKVGILTH